MYVHMDIYRYTDMCLWIYTDISISICIQTCIYLYIYIYIYMCLNMYVHMDIYRYTDMYLWIYMDISLCIWTCIYLYIYNDLDMHVHIQIYLCLRVHVQRSNVCSVCAWICGVCVDMWCVCVAMSCVCVDIVVEWESGDSRWMGNSKSGSCRWMRSFATHTQNNTALSQTTVIVMSYMNHVRHDYNGCLRQGCIVLCVRCKRSHSTTWPTHDPHVQGHVHTHTRVYYFSREERGTLCVNMYSLLHLECPCRVCVWTRPYYFSREERGTLCVSMYSLLHLECRLILVSKLNLLGLFSTEHGKRDLENWIIDWVLRLEKWHSTCNRIRIVGSLKT